MSGMHLFFGMIVDGRAIDPAPYLKVRPCGQIYEARAKEQQDADGKIPPSQVYARPGALSPTRAYAASR